MGKHKKKFDESLQETRHHRSNSVKYLKRVQQEHEADEEIKEVLRQEDDDADTIRTVL